jgi:hypothetical protein
MDGFLRLHDIYALYLNAELVVLSACESALGKEIRGEGLVGLTHGFMYAGAERVLASLWQIDDKSTAELFATFLPGCCAITRHPVRRYEPPSSRSPIRRREARRSTGRRSSCRASSIERLCDRAALVSALSDARIFHLDLGPGMVYYPA